MNAGVLLTQIDQQMIVAILGAESAGYYTNYLGLFHLYSIFISPLAGLLFPIITELMSKQQSEKVRMLLELLYKYFIVCGLLIGGALVAMGPTIAGVLFGEQFIYSGVLIRYTGMFVVLNILIMINFSVMAGMGKVKERMKIMLYALLINICGNILFMLVFQRGLVGAIIATVIGWITITYMTTRLLRKYYVFHVDIKFTLYNLLLIAILSFALAYIHTWFDRSTSVSRTMRLTYLGILLGTYGCIVIGINYRSVISLWQEVKHLQSSK